MKKHPTDKIIPIFQRLAAAVVPIYRCLVVLVIVGTIGLFFAIEKNVTPSKTLLWLGVLWMWSIALWVTHACYYPSNADLLLKKLQDEGKIKQVGPDRLEGIALMLYYCIVFVLTILMTAYTLR